MHFDKRKCLTRAKELVGQQNEAALRYASLELRYCIESITYEKLRTYAKRLPSEVLETWQPPQAFRALLEFEPSADQDFSLSFCQEDAGGRPTGARNSLGVHKVFRLSWLRKTYNALGNHLHVPLPSISGVFSKLDARRTSLEKLLVETIKTLEPIVETTLDCSIAAVVDFQCSVCNGIIIRNLESLEKESFATCLNPNCRAEYHATKNSETNAFEFVLKASNFPCLSCQNPIEIENRKVDIGFAFTCPECNSKHQICKKQWGYALQQNGQENS